MDLSNDLVSQFAKITTGDKDKNKETTVYGTVKVYDGITCVKIDGSDLLTPVDTTTEVKEGERVTVLIKNHSAVITGNTSDPSAGVSTTDKISGNVTKVEADIGEFKELTTENFRATNAVIENLTAKDAQIENLVATKASIEELEAVEAKIEDLDVEFINAEMANINDALIQKADIKDLNATNANIQELQADTARINEALITKADVTALEATWADIDSLEADIAEIDTALIGKATIEDLNAVRAEISDLNVTELEATVADINLALITKANVEDLEASQADIEKLQADTAKIDEALINKADVKDLNATNAKIDNLGVDSLRASVISVENALINKADVADLNATNANVTNLQADVAEIDEALIDKANVSDLNATNANVGKLQADVADLDEAIIYKASINDLNAANANIQELTARVGTINNAMMGKASIEELEAVEAKIEDLDVDILRADVADIEQAMINKANIADLNAANADIDSLNTQVANIQTLVGGNLTMDNMQSLNLTSSKVTVDDAFIKDAMIDSVTANKIMSGSIDTNKVTIKSADGSMTLTGSLQQFKDENGKVRIQIGKDSGGNFSFVLYDSTGKGVLIDEDGIKSSNAIADGLIVDSKVANNANISGSKLNIASVISAVNNDNSTTIKSNKIFLDEQNQSLEVAFNSLKTQVDTIQDITIDGDLTSVVQQVQSNTTQINVNKGNISTLTSENTIRKEEIKDLDDDIKSVSTSMNDKYTSLQQDLSGFKTTVGQTYTTKTEFSNLNVGGRNYISNSAFINGSTGWKLESNVSIDTTRTFNGHPTCKSAQSGRTANGWCGCVSYNLPTSNCGDFKAGETYTISCWYYVEDTTTFDGVISLEMKGKKTDGTSEIVLDGTRISVADLVQGTWTKITRTITFGHDVRDCCVRAWVEKNGTAWFADFKMEKGNKATDWTPAPEDVQGEIDKVNSNLTTNYSTTSAMNSAITQKANEITNTVSQTYTSKTEFNNLQVGGRNLVTGTKDYRGWIAQDGEVMLSGEYNGFVVQEQTLNWSYYRVPFDNTKLKVGESYTVSAYLKCDVKSPTVYVTFCKRNTGGAYTASFTSNVTSEWQRYSTTITLNNDMAFNSSNYYFRIEASGFDTTGMKLYVAGIKFEKGNKATDWTPAPEDVQNEIDDVDNKLTKNYSTTAQINSAITQKANEITNTVSQTYASKTELNNLQVGGKNLVSNSAPISTANWYNSTGWNISLVDCDKAPKTKAVRATANTAGVTGGMYKPPIDHTKFVNGANYTTSAWIRASKQITINFTQEAMNVDNYVTVTTEWKYYTFTHSINTSAQHHSNIFYITEGSNIAVGDWFEVHSLKLEKGDKATDWTPAPEDVDSKIYDVESKIQQTADAWTATFASSGGYNLIRNSTGSNHSTRQWKTSGSDTTLTTDTNDGPTGSPSRYYLHMKSENTDERYAYSTRFRLKPNTTYRFTGYFNTYTACKSFDAYVLGSSTLNETDGSFDFDAAHIYRIIDYQNTNGVWKKFSVTFTTSAGVRTGYLRIDHNGYNSSETSTPSLCWSAISLTQGEAEVPWSPHPDEIYSGTTTIDAQGIKVTQSDYNGYTSMRSDGFHIYDGSKDAVSITKDGAVFTGKMVVQSGSTVPTSVLSGKVASGQLDSAVTSDISTAKSNASTALSTANTAKSTANTAKSTADSVKTTVDNGINNWNNAYNRVSEWAYGAVSGSTTIDGGLIQANTILANKIALSDFTNYSQLNEMSASNLGFTVSRETDGVWYSYYPDRDKFISEYHSCAGFETLRVQYGISTTCKAYENSSATSATYVGTAIGIYCYDGNKTPIDIKYATRVTATSSGTPAQVSSTITLPANTRYFRVFIQTEAVGNFSGTIKVKNVLVTRMNSSELIVDGSINANKISSNAVTTDKLAANAVTAAKISAGAITTDKVTAGAITADKVAAGAITADKVAAGAITSKHVIIADSSNILIASPSENPYNCAIHDASDGSKYFKFGDNTTKAYYKCYMAKSGKNVSVKNTDKFRLVFRAYATLDITIKFIWRIVYTDNTYRDIIQYNLPITTSSTIYEKEVQANYQEPYLTKTIAFSEILFEFPNTALGYAYVKDASLVRKSGGDLIVDGSITAGKLAANAVTTDKLNANAVTAAKIASNAITADKITSGAITADKVAAGAIQAKHIAIGDYNNYSQLTKGKSIQTIYGTAQWIQGTDAHCYWNTNDQHFPFTSNGTPNHFSIGDTLQFKFEAYVTEAATKAVGVWFYNDTDSSSYMFECITDVRFSTGWNTYTVDVGPFTDSRIKQARSIMILIRTNYKHIEVRNATIQRKVAGTLIVDGTITTNKLAANAVTTDKLNANAVTADKIASNAITADKITSGAITADKLAANAITADKIAANAVTTDKLNANAVTAAKIASNAITADKIAAGSITTSKLAVKDGTNYSQLTDQTASQWGWTKQANSSDEFNCWYQKNGVNRDNQISEYYPCKGGETLRVKADIFTSVYGQSQLNGTATATARGATVMIFTQNTNNNKSYLPAEYVTAASTSGTTQSISSVITLPAEARRFAVYIQIDGFPTFSGTLRVRNVIVNKMSSGELIVDGSITAGKIAAGAITAGKIAAGAITADKIAAGAITANMINGGTLSAADEINFVGGARIFGTGGEHGAALTITASAYNLSGASQGFLGGSWDIGDNLIVTGTAKSKTLNVTSTSTLSGGVTCGSTLSVTGASTLSGAVSCGSSLTVGNVLNLQQRSVYLDTIWKTVTAPAIKFGTDSYLVGHGGIHIINTSGNAQTLRAGTIYSNGSTVTSDRRKKMDIRYVNVDKQSIGDSGRMAPNTNITIQDMHEFIGSLPLTSFRYKDEVRENRILTHYGFLTQDIMYSKVGSELVAMLDESKRIGDEEDYTGYSVEKLLMFVCGALQEEIHQRQLLEKEIKNLKEGK